MAMIRSNSAPSESTYPESSITPRNTPLAEEKYEAEIMRVVRKIGFTNATKITNTLQGSIWRASKTSNQTGKRQTAILKSTNQYLYRQRRAVINDQLYTEVKEDILSEQRILKYIAQRKNCPKEIVKFKWFFKTNTDYYLLMEDAGYSLFDFVVKGHRLIKSNIIQRSEWNRIIKVIFRQMIECVEFLHSHKICHFDISLENFLINDVAIELHPFKDNDETKYKIKFMDHIQIKLCDFGLAHMFNTFDFRSDKFCGKKKYQSPEVVRQENHFNAGKNDIWCLGICLYMMTFCSIPWDAANETDVSFVYCTNHSLDDLLKYWNILCDIDKHMLCLLKSIFQYESNRMSLREIKHYIN